MNPFRIELLYSLVMAGAMFVLYKQHLSPYLGTWVGMVNLEAFRSKPALVAHPDSLPARILQEERLVSCPEPVARE